MNEESTGDDVRRLLAVISGLPVMERDLYLSDIKKQTKGRFAKGPLKSELASVERERMAVTEGETDYGVIVATRVLDAHFEGGKHLINAADGFFWKYNGRYWEQVASENEIGNLCTKATLELGPIRKGVDTVVRQATNIMANLQALGGARCVSVNLHFPW